MKCDIPAEVGADILAVAWAEDWVGLDDDLTSDDGDQGLQGHEEGGDADHVIVEAGEAKCVSPRTDQTTLTPSVSRAVHNGQTWGRHNMDLE